MVEVDYRACFPLLCCDRWLTALLCGYRRCFRETIQELLEKEFDEAEAFEDDLNNNGSSANGEGGVGAASRGELAAELEIQEAVFMSSYIPRSLHEVDLVLLTCAVCYGGVGWGCCRRFAAFLAWCGVTVHMMRAMFSLLPPL